MAYACRRMQVVKTPFHSFHLANAHGGCIYSVILPPIVPGGKPLRPIEPIGTP